MHSGSVRTFKLNYRNERWEGSGRMEGKGKKNVTQIFFAVPEAKEHVASVLFDERILHPNYSEDIL